MSHVSEEKILIFELLLEISHVLLVALRLLTQFPFKIHDLLSHLKCIFGFAKRRTSYCFKLRLNPLNVSTLRLSLNTLRLDYLAHLFEELLCLNF